MPVRAGITGFANDLMIPKLANEGIATLREHRIRRTLENLDFSVVWLRDSPDGPVFGPEANFCTVTPASMNRQTAVLH